MRVRDRSSQPLPLLYAAPTVTGLVLYSGLKNESVTLRVTGTGFGLACSACVSWTSSGLPLCSGSSYVRQACAALACGTNPLPVVLITNNTVVVPCVPQCVDSSTGTSSMIQCRTSAPISQGNLTVSIAGQTSAIAWYAYEMLLPQPTLQNNPVLVQPITTQYGGSLNISGTALGSSGMVILTNDMGELAIAASQYTPSYVVVSAGAVKQSAGPRRTKVCLYSEAVVYHSYPLCHVGEELCAKCKQFVVGVGAVLAGEPAAVTRRCQPPRSSHGLNNVHELHLIHVPAAVHRDRLSDVVPHSWRHGA